MRVTDRCTVLIAAPENLPALRATAVPHPHGEVLEFADTEALKALEVIMNRRPAHVFIEGAFARTPRGAALIKRIDADPTLARSSVHVVTPHVADVAAPTATAAPPAPAAPEEHDGRENSHDQPAADGGTPHVSPSSTEPAGTAPALDRWGTRRAPRYAISGRVDIVVDGKQAQLVDLSTVGAQVVSSTVLKPNQRVRVALADTHGILRFSASVAWAAFEIDPGLGARYRAGLDFIDSDDMAIDAYGARHRQT